MSQTSITVEASARRTATPSAGTIEATVTAEGDSTTTARETARDRVATVRESVAGGDRSPTVRKTGIRVRATEDVFEYEGEFQYQTRVDLEIDAGVSAVDDVVSDVLAAGARVDDVRFGLDEGTSRRLRDEALEASVERAYEKAERIAAASGLELDGVQAVTTTTDSAGGMQDLVEDALGHGAADFAPEPVEVTQAVEVVFGAGCAEDGD